MERGYIGIDFGTTNLKTAVFSQTGELLACLRSSTPKPARGGGGYCPDEVFGLIESQLRQLSRSYSFEGIAVTGMAEAGILLERGTLKPLSGIIPWFDQCTGPMAQALEGQARAAFLKTGLRNSYKYGAYKYRWALDAAQRAAQGTIWLSACDWLVMRLTGACVTDPTFAARTYLYDIGLGTWSHERMELFGLAGGGLPEIMPSGSRAGFLRAGWLPGAGHVPVALCGHDHLCAALAAAHSRPGSICNSMGTAETFVGTRAARPLQAADFEAGLTWGPFVRPGRQYWMANIPSAGLCMEWVRCALPGHEISYEEVERALEKSAGPAQAMFFPWLSGTGTPTYRADLGGVFWGLTPACGWGEMVNAVVEGLSLWERCVLACVPQAEQAPVCAAGGACRSAAWMQRKADVLHRDVFCSGIQEGTLLGAVELMCEVCGLPFVPPKDRGRLFRPEAGAAERYDGIYSRYLEIAGMIQNRK